MNKEKVAEKLRELGFRLTELPDFGYSFNYEGLNLLYIFEDDDEEFVRLALPCIYEGNDDNRVFLLDLVNEVNGRLKYAKTILRENDVWVFFEADVYAEETLEQTLRHGIYALQAAQLCFYRLVTGKDGLTSNDSDEENDNETTEQLWKRKQ